MSKFNDLENAINLAIGDCLLSEDIDKEARELMDYLTETVLNLEEEFDPDEEFDDDEFDDDEFEEIEQEEANAR